MPSDVPFSRVPSATVVHRPAAALGKGGCTVHTKSVLGLPALLRLLSSHPDGARLTTCLNEGVLAVFGARATVMWLLEERDILSLVGFAGFEAEDLRRWHKIPLTFQSQMVDVVRNNEVIVTPSLEFPSLYPHASFDRAKYAEMMSRIGGGDLVGLPVVHQGLCLGVLQFLTAELHSWGSLDFSMLDGISAALGLWATHPDTPIAPVYTRAGQEPTLILSERQNDIIELVLRGVGNHQIAQELHVSVSTVKQDLQKLMRVTNQGDRVAAARCAVDMGLVPSAG